MLDVDDNVNNAEDSEAAVDSFETYIGAELKLPDADRNSVYGRIKKKVRNNDVQAVVVVNWNPSLDTSKYEVEYLDGYNEEMTNNQMDENMLSSIDSQGNNFLLIKEINDHLQICICILQGRRISDEKIRKFSRQEDNERLDFASRVEGRILLMGALGWFEAFQSYGVRWISSG